jgi:soluble lytic murein transglycosylase-like protein
VLTASLLAGAAPAQERVTAVAPLLEKAILGPAIFGPDDPRAKRMATNPRHRAIAVVTGLNITLAGLIAGEADHYGIPDKVLVGLIAQETGDTFNPSLVAVNTNGSRDFGLMQLNSGTYPWLASKLSLADVDPLEPVQNLQMGVWYLNLLLEECENDLDCALSRYNGDSTGRYARYVGARIERYGKLLKQAQERAGREEHKPEPTYGLAA